MPWIESHQSLSRHAKTVKAARLLRVDRHKLIGHLHELWWWALDNVPPNGDLTGFTDEDLGHEGAQWPKVGASRFVRVLTEVGFVDEDAGTRWLHDWHEFAGKLNERRAKERDRSRDRRIVARSTGGRPAADRKTDRPATDGTVTVPLPTTSLDTERDPSAREPDAIELGVRSLLNGGGTERQIDTFRDLHEQVGDAAFWGVVEEWKAAPVRNRYGSALTELKELARDRTPPKKPSRFAYMDVGS